MTDTQLLARLDTLDDKLRQMAAEYSALKNKLQIAEREAQNEKENLGKTIKELQERQLQMASGIEQRNQEIKDLEKELEKNKTINAKNSQNSNKYIKIAVEKALKNKKLPFQTTDDSAILKEELDNYIQEIERCIAELSV